MKPISLSLSEVMRRVLASREADAHNSLPGIIRTYDAGNQTAEIEIALTNPVESASDEIEDARETYPVLVSVPVAFPRAGAFFLHWPLTRGDSVLLVFNDLDPGAWRQSGSVSDPGTPTRNSLSYACAIPGYYPRNNPMPHADSTHGRIGKGAVFIEFRDAEIRVGGAESLVKAAAFDLLKSALDSWSPVANDGGAALKTLLTPILTNPAWTGSSTDITKGA